jgi:hypothetical protein
MNQRSEGKKCRGFTCTDYELNGEFWVNWRLKEKPTYWICGLEKCPTTERYHYQMYFYFENPRSFESIRKKLSPRHVERAIGTGEQNRVYCSKEGQFIEEGNYPKQGERTDLGGIMELIKKGVSEKDIAESFPQQWFQYRKGMTAYRELITPKRMEPTRVEIYHGAPGTGKTREAYEKYPNIASISISGNVDNPFIGGYDGESEVLLDDFNPRTCSREFMLKLCDRYPLALNVKNGTIKCAIKVIVITTNEDAKLWYSQDGAWLRRISEIKEFGKCSEKPTFFE